VLGISVQRTVERNAYDCIDVFFRGMLTVAPNVASA
jgi:hypothetical protein